MWTLRAGHHLETPKRTDLGQSDPDGFCLPSQHFSFSRKYSQLTTAIYILAPKSPPHVQITLYNPANLRIEFLGKCCCPNNEWWIIHCLGGSQITFLAWLWSLHSYFSFFSSLPIPRWREGLEFLSDGWKANSIHSKERARQSWVSYTWLVFVFLLESSGAKAELISLGRTMFPVTSLRKAGTRFTVKTKQ